MTGKGREGADMMERRKVDMLCVQETKWKGSKARNIEGGFKLFYHGVDGKRNGVGVILKEEYSKSVVEVKRVSDRVMNVKLEVEETVALSKRQEVELELAELKMLRFSLEVTTMDRIRNEFIKETEHVGGFGDKMQIDQALNQENTWDGTLDYLSQMFYIIHKHLYNAAAS
ncbi:hypothetical protein HF521_007413, partial [Silurus meridionalis]